MLNKIKFGLIALSLIIVNHSVLAKVTVSHLQTEGIENHPSIDNINPVLSWILHSNEREILQQAYEIIVWEGSPKGKISWESGKILSDRSVGITYAGEALKSSTAYFWQVRIWDNKGRMSDWSPISMWQTAILNNTEWHAKWIEPEQDSDDTRSPYLRVLFNSTKHVVSAIAHITSHGMYEAYINGHRIGEDYLTPGWTSYKDRLQYQTYDVTSMMNKGENVIGAILGNGWYRGVLNWIPRKNIYGNKLGFLFQLEIKYSDGSNQTIISDNSWKSSTAEILFSEIYDGETIDANFKQKGWNKPGFNDALWKPVKVVNYGYANLIATYNQPIRKQETFKANQILTTPKGEKVIDFGQNMVGWETFRIKGQKGDTIRIWHAEELDSDGNFYTDNLRSAKCLSTYILSGEDDFFEPHFTFYGFRYIKIEGLQKEIDPANFTAIALYSDMPLHGSLETSHPLINQLQSNIVWSQKGNFLDIPTDCPQRDERLGWTGDAHMFFRTAAFNRDVRNFFKKWMKDLSTDQYSDGRVPYVIPHTLPEDHAASTGWSDASTIIPWQHYMAYGEDEILIDQYPSMRAWVEYMIRNSVDYLWNTEKFHYGDWLFYSPDDDRDGMAAITDKYMIAQCFFSHSLQMLINTAEVLGYTQDVVKYSEVQKNVKEAFHKEYMTPSGRLISDTQTAYVLALNFDMLPERLRPQAVERLVENIERYNNHITTGFLGTPFICHVLSRFGRTDVAYRLLFQRTYPSWIYPVTAGATTIWERWDARKPDGTFQTDNMNSFNHYAYGAIGDWIYRISAGITESAPGYRKITIKPHPGGEFEWVSARKMTPYGQVASSWTLSNSTFELTVEIPANTTARILIPCSDPEKVKKNGEPLTINIFSNGYAELEVGSGKYIFSSLINK